MNKFVRIIGGGLAGSEAANYLLKRGYTVEMIERRPLVDDQAHETGMFGELVCSNSLKSKLLTNACGLLKEEMRRMDSILMESA
ncbi:MAG: FAD-dependent oxidoreductase, partial [Bacilli bacterium]|nr:FAD-dependent oxidoreductase [Bacilli bacterium]